MTINSLKINNPKCQILFLSVIFFILSGCAPGQLGLNNSGQYRNGMVVCAYPDAAQVGLDILKKGGNAVDAAVAVQFALAVTLPEAGNIGGGGFMVYRAGNGKTSTLDFREKGPGVANVNMYLDSAGNVIPNMSLYTHKASGVPGSVDGMIEAHHKYGKLKWADLIEPAIKLARNGFKITKHLASDLNRTAGQFKKLNPGKNYLVKEGEWKEGDLLIQEDLAKTFEQIRDKGRDGFYDGPVADLIVDEMKLGNGLITKADLKNYHAVWRDAIVGKYKEYKIITMPPPSSGGIALLQLLKSVEPYPLKGWGYNQDSTIRLIVEAERRVYADRSKYLGDPDFYKVPVDSLLQPAYITSRMKSFSWDAATPSTSIQPGSFVGYESDQTTHYSIVDREGNAVSVTTTLNDSFGSKIFVSGAGFLLNNEMDDFSSKPGVPNMYGLVGGKANSIQPGKRMLSSMTPTIIEKDGKLFMVVGTPGGSTIITSVFQTILNVIEFNQNMQQAVASKRFHSQWLPDEVTIEKDGVDSTTVGKLQSKGYKIVTTKSIGRVDAILKTKWGYYEGGADPRGDDTKMGW
ncbi:gamma-glutamyltransferase [Mucilaginibacter rubeus]|uniref:Glutathione hydrolase proenzyme n=1 Tax=Mucilaginibacter rubeus TaxID=2027860 RepID=A0AAE6JLJ6_9SPHI|nr:MULTISPECIES: gamma-glutamyltransferase [Mucilaginibacter]QEM07688.1 gamma-glutamyltransferase [Mucilaginibacter rubeus]QEM20142.1 gamma-glutamyltransferase [Mucilaginibacter gossypii]QTE43145.1 gamma-glutamyltransferase [Mucilaginibacter rubeus]QTE49745.1 gamma-glutamyltransferase [Mucilaginibacter rubeus]QTE54839.1 gamma-glutamyltransferase [Mucilaginibacter rubeus]